MTSPRLIRAGFFAWLAVPALLWLTVQVSGLPHMIWSYEWNERRTTANHLRPRQYTRCTYVGPYGAITEFSHDGRCDWVCFAKVGGR